ncbi:GspH/FimT family pseudopilin [Roseateles sp. DXS20W]|uniref:Type II secretion system protein H n=1 Tax=Pelomonas lactea TaxID=3299030 RepID=A0ABW7GNQ8_9BURK
MLTPYRQHGLSLIETMAVVVIMGIVMAMAVPNFGPWITGTRIRSTAEGLLAGLQYAKSEATTRNTQVRFQLTTSLGADCKRSTTGGNWVVDVVDADADTDSVEGQCNSTPDGTAAPSILQLRAASETGSNVSVSAEADQIIFNGLGRQAPVDVKKPVSPVAIDITPAAGGGTCATKTGGGKVTCLRILVSATGQVRMCNPKLSDDPQAC